MTGSADLALGTLAGSAEVDLHGRPPSAIHWTSTYVQPLLHAVGAAGLDALWAAHLRAICDHEPQRRKRLVSLGGGDGAVELGLLARLSAEGDDTLDVVLLDGSEPLLDRARTSARDRGLEHRLETRQVDLNTWTATEPADVYLASHSLHHVIELEHLLDELRASLSPHGVLLVNDMIGRNGHRRWPEALSVLHRLWAELPERYRYNHTTHTVDEVYADLDCSTERGEGVRAQDVLPLLLERFHPQEFVPFGNVIDPFVDRSYGWNFDPERRDDRAFLDRVASYDEAAIELGAHSPTHLIATFRTEPVAVRFPGARAPQRMVRRP